MTGQCTECNKESEKEVDHILRWVLNLNINKTKVNYLFQNDKSLEPTIKRSTLDSSAYLEICSYGSFKPFKILQLTLNFFKVILKF